MLSVSDIFARMPQHYRAGVLSAPRTYYFSVGDHKFTVRLTPTDCKVEPGKTVENADVVLKATPELFQRMVVEGKLPGAMDIALGRIKTNDPSGLQALKTLFAF
jgi:long-chain acyl-CoA synthetase